MDKKAKIEESDESSRLTLANISLKWWINKQKNDSDLDYTARVQFARFELERISGKKVKLK